MAASPATLEGFVVDPSGARIIHARVHVQQASVKQSSEETTTDGAGYFALSLAPGTYTVTVDFRGFEPFRKVVKLFEGAPVRLQVALAIPVLTEEIVVDADGAATDAADENKSALVFIGKDLNMFSDDNAMFQKQMLALAGGGSQPPQIYVNGFSSGRFPPKSSIREIRVNRNPYSALYESLGVRRLEISTKPGTDKLHGSFSSTGNDISFNAPNPYAGSQPPYYSVTLDGNLTGPIDEKTSFFVGGTYNNQQNNAAVNAFILGGSLQPLDVSEAVPNPLTTSTYSMRLDRQVSANNTLFGFYQFNQVSLTNGGVGLLALPSQGFNNGTTTQTVQLSDTQIIGAKMISEARFQYLRERLQQGPVSEQTSIVAEGSFNGGGSPAQQMRDNQDDYEFQYFLSRQQAAHFLRMGGRYRLYRDSNFSRAGYNGQFIFPSLTAYQIDEQVLAAHPGVDPATLDGLIRSTCVDQPTGPPVCGGASQYSLTIGKPGATVLTGDLAVFAEDEWKLARDVTINLGFRLETQSAVPDHIDPAPRATVAWAVHFKKAKPALFVLRAGAGIFYDRFTAANLLTAARQNGVTQQTFTVNDPDFYPSLTVPAVSPTIYTINPKLRTEYGLIGGFSLERALGKMGRISFNYNATRGDHQYFSRNINAPLPGTYDPNVPGSGVRPLGGDQNIYQFDSGGIEKRQLFYVTSRLNLNKWLLAYLSYTMEHTDADVSTASTFVSNSYHPQADFGRFAEPSQVLFTGGTVQLPLGLSSNIYFSAQKGTPFNITTGTDLNGDTIYNDRPTFATDLTRPSVVKTRFGNFDTSPIAGQTLIPINYGNSPNFVFLDLNLARSFGIGTRPLAKPNALGASSGPRGNPPLTLNLSVDAPNILNHVNRGTPVGVLGSRFFGQSISLSDNLSTNTAANRMVLLQMSLSF